jgi:hypothetical protein
MWFRMSPPAARRVATAAVSVACLASVVACSWLISDNLSTITCVVDSGTDFECPTGQVCSPNAGGGKLGTCVPQCANDNQCQSGFVCDTKGWCVDGGSSSNPDVTVIPFDAGIDVDSDFEEAAVDEAGDAGTVPPGRDAWSDASAGCNSYGCKCATNADCDPTLQLVCADRQALTPELWNVMADAGTDAGGSGSGFCMDPCCTSFDCPAGDGGIGSWVCFPTGVGGNYCVLPSWLGDRSAVGTGLGGASCNDDAGLGCRSGLCSSGACADTCCSTKSTNECAGGITCGFGQFPGGRFDTHEAAHCMGGGNGAGGSQCQSNFSCKSNLCVQTGGGGGTMPVFTCRDACINPDECIPAGTGRNQSTQACEYMPSGAAGPDIIAACTSLNPQGFGGMRGDAGAGSPCATWSDCTRGYCAPVTFNQGQCLVTCVNDTNCVHPERCRLQSVSIGNATYSVLACGT